MIITNKLGLPNSFLEMAKSDYIADTHTYRVTSLLKGVRETILEKRHNHEIEQDVSDMIWLLFGTAVHGMLEKQTELDNEIKESRITYPFGKYTLSGQFDLYNADTKTITDYKTCSVWKVINGDFGDWNKQLLIYAYMMRKCGFEVTQGQIIAIIKDHSKRDAKNKADYPKLPVEVIKFSFTQKDFDEIAEWLNSRFIEIDFYQDKADEVLPLCTEEERYYSGTTFAVMKKGRKSALRVLDTMENALDWLTENGGDCVQTRVGENKKCMDYCSVNKFCTFYQELITKEEENNDKDKE